jgi:hypothetical protein
MERARAIRVVDRSRAAGNVERAAEVVAAVTRLGRAALLVGVATSLPACDVNLWPSCKVEVGSRDHATEPRPASSRSATCPGPARSGSTGCFPGTCGPGQYCDDVVSECRPGCVTDENCGPRDACVRADDATAGRCEACSGLAFGPAAPACVVPERVGVTPCFPGECPVGQYCVDGDISHCEPGCVSDENCGPAERCDRAPAAALGMCRSCFEVRTP